jgi:hypothetical protein
MDNDGYYAHISSLEEFCGGLSELRYGFRIVAFIDLLGFSNRVISVRDYEHLEKDVLGVLASVYNISCSGREKDEWINTNDRKVTTFSDSVVVSSHVISEPSIYSSFLSVSELLRSVCGASLEGGFLFRGGISIGRMYHAGNIVVGEGLIDSYNIESKVANSPRIVISDKVIECMQKVPMAFVDAHTIYQIENTISRDIDGRYIYDYIKHTKYIKECAAECVCQYKKAILSARNAVNVGGNPMSKSKIYDKIEWAEQYASKHKHLIKDATHLKHRPGSICFDNWWEG